METSSVEFSNETGVTKVKGHSTDEDVEQGQAGAEDKYRNAQADAAAEVGRRYQSEVVMYARRVLVNARGYWYPIMIQLHKFMVAVSGVSVNHDEGGCNAPGPMVWDRGGAAKRSLVDVRINVYFASLLGPLGYLHGPWSQVHAGAVTGVDVLVWPYRVNVQCKFTSFLGSLQWPSEIGDLRHHGASYLQLLVLFDQWMEHRLIGEKVVRPYRRANRLHSLHSALSREELNAAGSGIWSASSVRVGVHPDHLNRGIPTASRRFVILVVQLLSFWTVH